MTRRLFVAAFGSAFLAGAAVVIGPAAYERLARSRTSPTALRAPVAIEPLADGISVAGQIGLADLAEVQARGFRRVIDLRPDGEAPDQPSAGDVGAAAARLGMSFSYVPVPHGEMPDAVADQLTAALSDADGPVLLYCRSGRRAARAWALAESSRTGGMPVETIRDRVASTGQTVDDLVERLSRRAAGRHIVN